jgi:protein-disulfide isomerase
MGVDPAQSMSTPVTDQLAEVAALSEKLRLEGTPSFIVGDTVISNASIQDIQTAIALARSASY